MLLRIDTRDPLSSPDAQVLQPETRRRAVVCGTTAKALLKTFGVTSTHRLDARRMTRAPFVSPPFWPASPRAGQLVSTVARAQFIGVAVLNPSMDAPCVQDARVASIANSLPQEVRPPGRLSCDRNHGSPERRLESSRHVIETSMHSSPLSSWPMCPAPPVAHQQTRHCLAAILPGSRRLLLAAHSQS